MVSTEVDAGFRIPLGQKKGHRKGLQFFVRVCRYSDELLAELPETGGLLENEKKARAHAALNDRSWERRVDACCDGKKR
jgi:hypothetical protein